MVPVTEATRALAVINANEPDAKVRLPGEGCWVLLAFSRPRWAGPSPPPGDRALGAQKPDDSILVPGDRGPCGCPERWLFLLFQGVCPPPKAGNNREGPS